MTFGAEAMLPTDLDYGSPRVRAYDEERSQAALQDSLDQLQEAREVALLRSAKYQQSLRRLHARRVRGRALNVGDIVLRRVQTKADQHKLSLP